MVSLKGFLCFRCYDFTEKRLSDGISKFHIFSSKLRNAHSVHEKLRTPFYRGRKPGSMARSCGRESFDPPLANYQVRRKKRGRSPAGREPVIDWSEVKRFRDEQQPEENRDGNEREKPGAASEQVTLGHKRDEAFMGDVPGIFVQPVMKLGGSGQRGGAEPEQEHETDDEDSANPALTASGQANLHVRIHSTTC